MAIQSEFSKKYIIDMEQKLPLIIDAFCTLYGEKYRETINRRLEDILFIYSGSNDDLYSASKISTINLTREQKVRLNDLRMAYNGANRLLLAENAIEFLLQSMPNVNLKYINDLKDEIDTEFQSTLGTCGLIPNKDVSKLYKVVHYKMDMLSDGVFVHEIIHALSADIIKFSNSCLLVATGIDAYEDPGGGIVFMDMETYNSYMKTRMLNEVITEFINEEICQYLRENGICIHNNQTNYFSNYSKSIVLFKPLFEKIKPALIDAYITNDISKLERLLGKKEFEDLKEKNKLLLIDEDINAIMIYFKATGLNKLAEEADSMDYDKASDSMKILKDSRQLVRDLIERLEKKQ